MCFKIEDYQCYARQLTTRERQVVKLTGDVPAAMSSFYTVYELKQVTLMCMALMLFKRELCWLLKMTYKELFNGVNIMFMCSAVSDGVAKEGTVDIDTVADDYLIQ